LNEINESDMHSEKHDLPRYVTDDGIIIVVNPEEENADSLIRCKFDSVSNKIDESELQNEKHDLRKYATDDGITIIINLE
jgi:hypothetical protein